MNQLQNQRQIKKLEDQVLDHRKCSEEKIKLWVLLNKDGKDFHYCKIIKKICEYQSEETIKRRGTNYYICTRIKREK